MEKKKNEFPRSLLRGVQCRCFNLLNGGSCRSHCRVRSPWCVLLAARRHRSDADDQADGIDGADVRRLKSISIAHIRENRERKGETEEDGNIGPSTPRSAFESQSGNRYDFGTADSYSRSSRAASPIFSVIIYLAMSVELVSVAVRRVAGLFRPMNRESAIRRQVSKSISRAQLRRLPSFRNFNKQIHLVGIQYC